MPPVTALLHARNDALRIGRALETLRFPAEVIVVDHGSTDRTIAVARQYGVRIVSAAENCDQYLPVTNEWIFCLTTRESITEDLESSLFEWSLLPACNVAAGLCYSVSIREELNQGWIQHSQPETRLVPRKWPFAPNLLPEPCPSAQMLEGALCRFWLP